jgi:hypothetical protein
LGRFSVRTDGGGRIAWQSRLEILRDRAEYLLLLAVALLSFGGRTTSDVWTRGPDQSAPIVQMATNANETNSPRRSQLHTAHGG